MSTNQLNRSPTRIYTAPIIQHTNTTTTTTTGMSGNTFYNDLFYLDTTLAKWTEVRDSKKRPAPCPRSAHSGN